MIKTAMYGLCTGARTVLFGAHRPTFLLCGYSATSIFDFFNTIATLSPVDVAYLRTPWLTIGMAARDGKRSLDDHGPVIARTAAAAFLQSLETNISATQCLP